MELRVNVETRIISDGISVKPRWINKSVLKIRLADLTVGLTAGRCFENEVQGSNMPLASMTWQVPSLGTAWASFRPREYNS